MKFSRLLIMGATAAIVAVVLGGSFAAASSRSGEDTDLRLVEIRTSVVPVDLPPSGPSAGDEFLLQGRLRNAANTATVGTAKDECTVISASTQQFHCETTIALAGSGTLEASGIAGGITFTFAILGGTRAYDHAQGQLTGSPGPNGTTLVTIDIDT